MFAPKLEVHSALEAPPNPPTREQGTDRPGRAVESVGARRSGMEQTDWHAQAEAAFLGKVAGTLAELCRNGEVRRLVLVAAPRALADLRAALPAAVREKTVAEIDKDLTKHPIAQVEKILAAL